MTMHLTTVTTLITGEPSTELLERQGELDALAGLLDDVRDQRRGWLVLVAGEAGVGKTALLRRFCDEQRSSARILWGACDALYTPSPLGPLIEIAESSGGEMEALVHGEAKPYEVATALMHELDRHGSSCSCSKTSTGPTKRPPMWFVCSGARWKVFPPSSS